MNLQEVIKKSCIIYILTCALISYAQQGHIQGRIIDQDGINITGATVVIEQLAKGTVSDVQGRFFFLNIPVGIYELQVDYLGYASVKVMTEVTNNSSNILSITLVPESIVLSNVVLTAFRNDGHVRALNTQKNNINVTNIVSIDQTGKFPDINIGEALRRIPGIAMQSDQGEARAIIIRGLAPELNSVMLNGTRIPSAEGDNRNVQMDLIPADMIEMVEVNKTLTPDMDADALGGAVNLITRTSPEGFRLSSTLGVGLNFIASRRVLNGTFLIGNRSKNNKFGWVASAVINDNDFGSDNIEGEWKDTFEYNSGEIDEDGEPIINEVSVKPYTKELAQQTNLIQRIRRSFTANFDYRFNSNHEIFVRTMFNWRDERENRFVFEQEVLEGEDIEEDDFVISDNNLTSFLAEVSRQTIGGIDGKRSKNARLEDQRMQNYSVGGYHFFNKIRFDWRTSFSSASEEISHERVAEFKSEYTVNNAITDDRFPFFTPENASDPDALENFFYEDIIEENKFTKEEDFNFLGNFELPISLLKDKEGVLKTGAKYRYKFKKRNNRFDNFDMEEMYPTLALVPVRDYSDPDFMVGSQYQAGMFADKVWLGSLLLNNGESVPEEFLRKQMSIKEKVFAGYAMIDQDLSSRLHLIAGLRIEHTKIKAKANQIIDFESLEERVTSEQSYTNILPGVHFQYDFTDQTILKFAWTNTIARPNYVDLVPTLDIVFSDEEIVLGNPALNPTTSMNFDITGEHYFKTIGLLSVNAFYKYIDGFIYTFKTKTVDDMFGPGTTDFDLFQPLNGESASLFGMEFDFQKQLSFLPGFGKNFSINFNYSYLTSSTSGIRSSNGEEREDLNLPNTASHVFNCAIGYDSKKVNSRLALNYTDDYLIEIGRDAFEDVYYDEQLFLDFNLNYALNDHLSLYTAINNITNQPLRLYQGISGRTALDEYYGRRITVGVKYDFFKKHNTTID